MIKKEWTMAVIGRRSALSLGRGFVRQHIEPREGSIPSSPELSTIYKQVKENRIKSDRKFGKLVIGVNEKQLV